MLVPDTEQDERNKHIHAWFSPNYNKTCKQCQQKTKVPLTEGCMTGLCVTAWLVCHLSQPSSPCCSAPPGWLDAINLQLSYSLSVIFKPASSPRELRLSANLSLWAGVHTGINQFAMCYIVELLCLWDYLLLCCSCVSQCVCVCVCLLMTKHW